MICVIKNCNASIVAVYQEVMDDSRVLINLASKEYFGCIRKYLQSGDCYITCIFGEPEDGKKKQLR